jgi:hypothetical protein
MKKMNMVEKFVAVKAMLNGEKVEGFTLQDALTFLDGRIEVVNNKNAKGGERKPTKTQLENEGIKAQIIEVLSAAEQPMSIGDIGKEIDIPSNQKVSALVSQMLTVRKGVPNPEGCIVRTEVKGKAYFALAKTDNEE